MFTDELKRLTLGLSDADWSTLVVNKLHLNGILTPEDLVSQWKQNMTVLMPDVKFCFRFVASSDVLYVHSSGQGLFRCIWISRTARGKRHTSGHCHQL